MVTLHSIDREPASRQQPMTAAEITAIVRRAFGPAAMPRRADEIGTGTVNTTYRLAPVTGTPCILRVGPARAATATGPSWLTADTLQREHALTPYLAPIASLLPRTLGADFTRQLIDRDWVIQTLVPGRSWSDIEGTLTGEENGSLWRQLGTITRQIHAVEGPAFGPLPPGRSFARWSALLAHDSGDLVADFARFGLPEEAPRLVRWFVAERAPMLDAASSPRLIHSDLDQRHVFVQRDRAGRPIITGIIDHEFGRFADPLSESLLLTLPGRPEAAPFFETYGPLPDDDASRWRARLYEAIALGWTAGDQAHQGQDVRATVAALARIVRELAAGR